MDIEMRANSTPNNEVMSDFLTRVCGGKVGQTVSLDSSGMTQRYFKPALDLSIPSFDFGTSFPTHTSAEAWNAMETQAAEAASEIAAWRPTTCGKCVYGET
jgi:hypothetical protein